jgi:hypothetical protein
VGALLQRLTRENAEFLAQRNALGAQVQALHAELDAAAAAQPLGRCDPRPWLWGGGGKGCAARWGAWAPPVVAHVRQTAPWHGHPAPAPFPPSSCLHPYPPLTPQAQPPHRVASPARRPGGAGGAAGAAGAGSGDAEGLPGAGQQPADAGGRTPGGWGGGGAPGYFWGGVGEQVAAGAGGEACRCLGWAVGLVVLVESR